MVVVEKQTFLVGREEKERFRILWRREFSWPTHLMMNFVSVTTLKNFVFLPIGTFPAQQSCCTHRNIQVFYNSVILGYVWEHLARFKRMTLADTPSFESSTKTSTIEWKTPFLNLKRHNSNNSSAAGSAAVSGNSPKPPQEGGTHLLQLVSDGGDRYTVP